jgi:hypothetical protein
VEGADPLTRTGEAPIIELTYTLYFRLRRC